VLSDALPQYKAAALQVLLQSASSPAVAAAATAAAFSSRQRTSLQRPQTLLFEPKLVDYQQHLTSTQVLNRLSSPDPDYGLYVQFGHGQRFGINVAVNDDGSNILLISEAQCKRMGIQILTSNLPELRGIDGELRPYIIGRTPPAELTVGLGTAAPMRKQVPCLWVVQGDAGGMYDVLIDKETFKEWYAHVSPVFGHYIWFPKAAEGDLSVINGVPVQSSVSRQTAMAAVAGHFACTVQQPFTLQPSTTSLVQASIELSDTVNQLLIQQALHAPPTAQQHLANTPPLGHGVVRQPAAVGPQGQVTNARLYQDLRRHNQPVAFPVVQGPAQASSVSPARRP
jgi:hypothetical protein